MNGVPDAAIASAFQLGDHIPVPAIDALCTIQAWKLALSMVEFNRGMNSLLRFNAKSRAWKGRKLNTDARAMVKPSGRSAIRMLWTPREVAMVVYSRPWMLLGATVPFGAKAQNTLPPEMDAVNVGDFLQTERTVKLAISFDPSTARRGRVVCDTVSLLCTPNTSGLL